MTPKTLALLVEIERNSRAYSRRLRSSVSDLNDAATDLPVIASQLHAMLAESQQINDRLQQTTREQRNKVEVEKVLKPPTPVEEKQLLALNQQLTVVTRHLRTVLNEVAPALEAKLADPADPMCDYEIDAHIWYHAHDDDPEVANDDSLLFEAEYLMKNNVQWEEVEQTYLPIPAGLLVHPHCTLFHDLYTKSDGDNFQNLSFRDCLRIDRVLVDVQVAYQYAFSALNDSAVDTARVD